MNTEQTQAFIFAGNARFTIRSKTTGVRFTYRVRAKDTDDGRTLHFVSVLTGSDNDNDFTFLGTIFDCQTYRHGRKSRIGSDAPSAKAFEWAFPRIVAGDLSKFEVHHEGRCGRCARALTVPESIEMGLGPDCAGMMGFTVSKAVSAPVTPAPVEDDQEPGNAGTPPVGALAGRYDEPGQAEANEP